MTILAWNFFVCGYPAKLCQTVQKHVWIYMRQGSIKAMLHCMVVCLAPLFMVTKLAFLMWRPNAKLI